MGMYNDVIVRQKITCTQCESSVTGWQTKDMCYAGYQLENLLQQLKLNTRMSGSIHTSCDNCKQWIEFGVIKGKLVPLSNYETYVKQERDKKIVKTGQGS